MQTLKQLMPPPLKSLLWGGTNGGTFYACVGQMTHCSNDLPVRQLQLPTVRGLDDPQIWAEIPEVDDPRWIDYHDTRPVKGQQILCHGKIWPNNRALNFNEWTPDRRYHSVERYSEEPMAFPGFMGSPHDRNWGLLKWMPIKQAFTDAYRIPEGFLRKPTTFQWSQEQRKAENERLIRDIVLILLNDGQTYKDHFLPICEQGRYAILYKTKKGPTGRPLIRNSFWKTVRRAYYHYWEREGKDVDLPSHPNCEVWQPIVSQLAHYYLDHSLELA